MAVVDPHRCSLLFSSFWVEDSLISLIDFTGEGETDKVLERTWEDMCAAGCCASYFLMELEGSAFSDVGDSEGGVGCRQRG